MSWESFTFKGANGKEVFCCHWDTKGRPKAVIQIFHGLAEHSGRYADFAAFMNSLGYTVYACDERGHGKTGELNHDLCDLEDDGFNGIVKDQSILTKRIRENHPGVPLFVFAHSFGSYIGQEYIKHYGEEVDGIILSGSCRMGGAFYLIGTILMGLMRLFGKSRPNRLADWMTFGSFNKRIGRPKSKFDWISCNEEQVKKYDDDPFCGFIVSSNFFYYLSKAMWQLNRNIASIPRNLPVYIIAGAEDPVGKYGKGVKQLYEGYGRLGLKDLQMKLYPGYRHEIINELNKEEVRQDVSAWLQKHIVISESAQA